VNIGNLYNSQRNTIKSKRQYINARNIFLNLKNDYGYASVNNNLGIVHELLGENEDALISFKESHSIYKRLKRENGIAITSNNIGNVFITLNELDSVLPYLDLANSLYSELNDTIGMCSVFINYGNYYFKISEDDKAVDYLRTALKISISQGLIEKEEKIYHYLSANYYKQKEYEIAFEYLLLADSLHNEIDSDDNEVRFQQLDEYYRDEASKQDIAIKELELKNSKNTLRNNQLFSFVLIVSLIIIISLLVFLYNRFKKINSIKLELENTNKQLHQINKDYRETLISKEEKEVLLQEIHHRVKNNLQIIYSLLRFIAMKGYSETRELILELQTRITAMSLLHEQLYKNEDISKINVKDYIELLINNLNSAYARNFSIDVHQDIKVESLDLDTLHPLGLLINEIISNSLKHAFHKDIENCNVYIKLFEKDEIYYLEIGDNGIGFNPELILGSTNNLGIELISSLISQLGGKMETIGDNGTHYRITFT
jgi:two-component sensor histidine kinase